MTNSFAKNGKKRFIVFLHFIFFCFLTPQNNLQIQIWGCPNFLFLLFFCQGTPYATNFHFKYIFISSCTFDNLSFGFFIFFQIFLLSAFICICMPQVFEQSLFLLLLAILRTEGNSPVADAYLYRD